MNGGMMPAALAEGKKLRVTSRDVTAYSVTGSFPI